MKAELKEAQEEAAKAELLERATKMRAARADLARREFNTFVEFVMKDEETQEFLHQSPTHVGWSQEAEKHDRLVIWSHVEAGKTQQIAIARTLWELGKDSTLRFLILSDISTQAEKILRTIKKYIETSAELHEVFPDLVPGDQWTDVAIRVKSTVIQKDPNVQCIGIDGNVTGARLDRVVCDDILNYQNTRTEEQRTEVKNKYKTMVPGRMTKRCRVLVIGTAYHPDDALHWFGTTPGYTAYRYPVIDPTTGAARWPEKWPLERIEKRKGELGPVEFSRQMLCVARDDTTARFKEEWIDKCKALGNGRSFIPEIRAMPIGGRCYTGVDLGVQRHAKSDFTSLFTIFVHPRGQREPIDVDSGRWSGPEIVTKIREKHLKYQSIMIVENNAAQQFIIDFAQDGAAIPIKPFTTGKNKANPEFGIESLAVEMSQGLWIIPNHDGVMHPELVAWVAEMLYYSPLAHTGDRLMASWFAKEGLRLGQATSKAETGRLNLLNR